MKISGLSNIWSEQKFYKKSGKYSKPKKYRKRLSNVQYFAKAADDFLNGAKFHKENDLHAIRTYELVQGKCRRSTRGHGRESATICSHRQ